MAFDFQVAIDCSSPHELADWWAEVLGWGVEAQDEAFIRRMVETGAATEDDTTTHRGKLVWRVGAAIISPLPDRPRVLFQQVPEPKVGKNRLHLDVRVGVERQEAEVSRLLALGATELWRGSQGPHTWVTMADPEGNEFCVA
jgi:Glyoxalase-like domain